MSQTVIFAEQTLTGFSNEAGLGYAVIQAPAEFTLVTGETYNVVWGNETYNGLTAYEAEIDGSACVYIGDGSALGYPGNGELFAIICFDGFNMLSSYADSSNTRTVAIYQVTEDDTPEEDIPDSVDVVLRDHTGAAITYEGIKTVSFDTPKAGERVTFTYGTEQIGKEVDLSMKDGDQIVKADAGKLLREITIKKPTTLLPENIRHGKTVGGVVGQFIGNIEDANVDLDFSSGDQEVVPSAADKVLSKVTIEKPEALIPENIAYGVDVAGVVGTLKGGSEPDVEYTYDTSGNIIGATVRGNILPSFADIKSLQWVDLTDYTGKSIGRHAFYNCSALKTVNIPSSVVSIEGYAFYNCTQLTNITIPESVTSIGEYAFYYCSSFTSITVPGSVKSISNYAFKQCRKVTSINLEEGVEVVGEYAFENCIEVTAVYLPNSLKEIQQRAFLSLSKLPSIIIPDGVTIIDTYAFYGCSKLTQVTIGSGVEYIGPYALMYVTSVVFKDTTGWYVTGTKGATSGTNLSSSNLADESTAATYLKSNYNFYHWYKT